MNKKLLFSALFAAATFTTGLVPADWLSDIKDAWAKAKQQAEEQYGKRTENPQTEDEYRRPEAPKSFKKAQEVTRANSGTLQK